jgi:UDP-N-acetylmuramoyl-tripeptide--D-alanyl-D-alanine ligase
VIPLPLDTVADLCPGHLRTAPGATEVSGVLIDSRRVSGGELFVAVARGDQFVDDALARGAAAALVPDDAFAALAALGAAVRDRSPARTVGITGSAGKTSTKDILAAICSPLARTVAAEASFNNELGVPLTLCRLEWDTEICVLELAMRGLGQIAELCDVARPHVGVITNVGPAHLGLLGSLDSIVRAKGELIEALPAGGTAVVPDDFPVHRSDVEVIRVGEPESRRVDGRTLVRFADREIAFDFIARHQARNALAALHAARAVGIEAEDEVEVAFTRWRGDETPFPGDGLLINDSYNANPVSMRAALEHLVERAEGRRTVAVLGDMAELGPDGPAYHRELGRLAGKLGVGALVGVGPLARDYVAAAVEVPTRRWTPTAEDGLAQVEALLRPGDCVLVKGSRAIGLESIAEALATVRL